MVVILQQRGSEDMPDFQVGAGYIYQWECATLLAINYLFEPHDNYNPELHKTISDFLGNVESIHLEGKKYGKQIDLEDINLVSGKKIILIGAKGKENEHTLWNPTDELFLKALYRFYKNGSFDKANENVRVVFLSNRGCNKALGVLQGDINKGVAATSVTAKRIFSSLKKYVSREYKVTEVDQERFLRMLEALSIIEFFSEKELEVINKNKLQAQGIDPEKYNDLYIAISKKSVEKGGCIIHSTDISNLVGGFFAGRLIDRVHPEIDKQISNYFMRKADMISLPPLGTKCSSLLSKVETIIGKKADVINEIESFLIIVSLCVPFLLHHQGKYHNQNVSEEEFSELVDTLGNDPEISEVMRERLKELSREVLLVTNSIRGFNFEDERYNSINIRSSSIRTRLLCALAHLSHFLNLDQYVHPNKPKGMTDNVAIDWWRQAYVKSVSIENNRVRLHITLPVKQKEQYRAVLVEPLDEKIKKQLQEYSSNIREECLNLFHSPAEVTDANLLPIPENEWVALKQKIETELAYERQENIHKDIIHSQHLRDLLVFAHIKQAELMLAEQRFQDAAIAFSQVAEILIKENHPVQAMQCYEKAAENDMHVGNHRLAIEQYIFAVTTCLKSSLNPVHIHRALEEARKLLPQVSDLSLKVRFLLADAWVKFHEFDDKKSGELFDECKVLVSQEVDERKRAVLMDEWVLSNVVFKLVMEQWDSAVEILDLAYKSYSEVMINERVKALLQLIQICTIKGIWTDADEFFVQALRYIDQIDDPTLKSKIYMYYGASQAQRGEVDCAHGLYSKGIQVLEGQGDSYSLSIIYQDMGYSLSKNGGWIYDGFEHNEMRRLDLFFRTQADNVGYLLQNKAQTALLEHKLREGLMNARAALVYYWDKGMWLGVDDIYKLSAKIFIESKNHVLALEHTIRSGDLEQAKKICELLILETNLEQMKEIIGVIKSSWPTYYQKQVLVNILRELSDVIPEADKDDMFDLLLSFASAEPNNNRMAIEVQRCSFDALNNMVEPLSEKQLEECIALCLRQLNEPLFWTVRENLITLIERCFLRNDIRLTQDQYAASVIALLNIKGDNRIKNVAFRATVNIAHDAPDIIREKVMVGRALCFLDRVWLGIQPEKSEVQAEIKRVLEQINVVPKETIMDGKKQMQFHMGGITPAMLKNYVHILDQELFEEALNGLITVIKNPYNQMGARSSAIDTLLTFPVDLLRANKKKILDVLILGSEGRLPTSTMVDMELESLSNPFSNFRINGGTIDQTKRVSLLALGQMYSLASKKWKQKIEQILVAASRSGSSIVRHGVALALDKIEENEIPQQLMMVLLVLLHDHDQLTCARTCGAAGRLLEHGFVNTFVEEIIERLIYLGQHSKSVEIRTGVAIGLSIICKNKKILGKHNEQVHQTLVALSKDISFRVRSNVKF